MQSLIYRKGGIRDKKKIMEKLCLKERQKV